jgi:nitrate reductase gamma subunit
MDYLLFVVFPYACLAVFLVGSIYRYTNKAFSVSSLSSQFLEGKKLFMASQFFHWGLFFLFFGHLIAFLFPKSVLLWNSQPIRLIILEVTAFVFGLSAFIGLVLLIIRRLTDRRVQIVTTKMDFVVFIILLVQIVSGLLVAYHSRWGSAWFASFITPYLRSIFVFNPQVDAIASVTSLSLKVHVVSAFAMIGIIPFTRFMHFLVYPVDYLWRSYQRVIWNWNKSTIRSSHAHSPGRKAMNN